MVTLECDAGYASPAHVDYEVVKEFLRYYNSLLL